MEDRNCLSYWFPRLQARLLPVPRTEIVTTNCRLTDLLDGVTPEGHGEFIKTVRAACDRIGWPVFLRTGHTSGKHQWGDTCYVESADDLGRHVANLVEFSQMINIIGLPTRVWAVREFLKLEHYFTAFNGMPVATEFRGFVRDGECTCIHFYWPEASIRNPSREDWRELLKKQGDNTLEFAGAADLIYRASRALGPDTELGTAWSIDVAKTIDGRWLITDVAEYDRSFHWPGCPNAPASSRKDPNAAESAQLENA